jgi:predicted HNH restriction endonuclease
VEENGQRLSVDHVIPWRTFTDEAAANAGTNLVALCRSCHAKKQRAESLWLRGDVLDMQRYQAAVAEPWGETA